MWECGVAQDVWAGSRISLQKCPTLMGDMVKLFEWLVDRLAEEDMERFLVQCWVLWNQRNAILHGDTIQDPSVLGQRAETMLHDYRDAQSHLSVPLPSSSKASGFGVVIPNERGESMAAVSARVLSVQNSEEAEALACRKAVEVAMDFGFRDVTLEGDNISVMNSISSAGINRARLGFVYDDIRSMGRGFRSFRVNHVRRTANTVAHSLAKYAGLIEGEMVWLEEDPPPARDALYSDYCHISL
ncbi:hypothetical protein SO802_002439 [Lithocarpus litseifolius]|uniref:RNase H type-1 domain-containing protein n=1 Tax=Lithocarpus litseifolius TaxID=425828 RepID=A0AAW2E1B6_9ROSI